MANIATVEGGTIINAQTMTATITSSVVDIKANKTVVGLQVVCATGTHVGTFAVQQSISSDDWEAISLTTDGGAGATSIAVSSGAAADHYIELKNLSGLFLRFVYTYTSGTGSLTVYASVKDV